MLSFLTGLVLLAWSFRLLTLGLKGFAWLLARVLGDDDASAPPPAVYATELLTGLALAACMALYAVSYVRAEPVRFDVLYLGLGFGGAAFVLGAHAAREGRAGGKAGRAGARGARLSLALGLPLYLLIGLTPRLVLAAPFLRTAFDAAYRIAIALSALPLLRLAAAVVAVYYVVVGARTLASGGRGVRARVRRALK